VVWKRAGEGNKALYGLYIKNWGHLDRLLERKLNEMEASEIAAKKDDNSSSGQASNYAPLAA
jgi:hypothetical protein